MEIGIKNWVQKIKEGDRLSLSKAITLVESEVPTHREQATELMAEIESIKTNSYRLAVTGVPGAGKSTLIDLLGMKWIEAGHRVAVLAIDPTSSISHGSVLGDKTRMVQISRHPNAFVRPSPTRLHLGGIASTSYETVLLCEAAGFNRILIETVGVGQSETLVSHLCDACLLLLVTGTGDDLQGVKRGILETADVIFVNKADGRNQDLAKSFARELTSLSSLWPNRLTGQKASIFSGSALDGASIDSLLAAVESFFNTISQSSALSDNRKNQRLFWLDQNLERRVHQLMFHHPEWKKMLDLARKEMMDGKLSLSQAVEKVVKALFRYY